jgi:hypothetical protein
LYPRGPASALVFNDLMAPRGAVRNIKFVDLPGPGTRRGPARNRGSFEGVVDK